MLYVPREGFIYVWMCRVGILTQTIELSAQYYLFVYYFKKMYAVFWPKWVSLGSKIKRYNISFNKNIYT